MELFRYVGERIRELRNKYAGGSGISQEGLANELEIAPNTVSRWETGTYRPGIDDLDRLGRFFGVSIMEFFPKQQEPTEPRVQALLRLTRDLPEEDFAELQKYA